MIEDKEIPSDYVSIRHIWLKGIEDCRKAISQVSMVDASSEMKLIELAGPRTVKHTVDALYFSLVDVGEAMIKTDVDRWRNEHYIPRVEKIWKQYNRKKNRTVEFAGFENEEDDRDPSTSERWWDHARLSMDFYEHILKVLNVYGMLFPEPYQGYSNVIMEDVLEGEN